MGNYKGEDRLEKHFTPPQLLDAMWNLAKDIDATEYMENSAGDGAIIDYVIKPTGKPYIAYDIQNDTKREDIKECDYLKEKIEYKKGRVAIINPPFNKGLKFVYKALTEGDWCIALLSPSSLLNMDYTKYWVEPTEIELWPKQDFNTCIMSVVIMKIRLKKEGDKYEYEI